MPLGMKWDLRDRTRHGLSAARSLLLLSLPLLFGRPIRRRSLAERLAALPLRGTPLAQPVTISWNDHQVPWISARTDRDCAVALGLVHAHLRIGQMEVLRRIAQGRTAEMLGPAATRVDQALRTLGLATAVPAILAMMPQETRQWVDGFVDGINHYLARVEEWPSDFTLLALKQDFWTAADVITLGRAAAADVNWLVWFRLWWLRDRPGWPELWERFLEHGPGMIANLVGQFPEALLASALGTSRTGSNAWAVHARASATGGALLACDPHLPITLPNPWLIAAYRCPSYQVAGLMLPGLPFVAVGRNPWIAWGGTAAHAASSDLFDLSSLQDEPVETRREVIRVRGGRSAEVEIRMSRFGPVISDAVAMGGTYALRWIGHEPSDETSAMLGINRARNVEEFIAAADLMGVPGENFIVAEVSGGIAKHLAVKLPRRPASPLNEIVSRPADVAYWERLATGRDFPIERNPACDFVVSANDRPGEGSLPVGFLFSPPDRAERIASVLAASKPLSLMLTCRLQRDVNLAGARALRDRLLQLIEVLPHGAQAASRGRTGMILRDWDGSYAVDSRGALAFELLVAHLTARYHDETERAFHASVWTARALIAGELDAAPRDELLVALSEAIEKTNKDLDRYEAWGDIHRLVLSHPLSRLPLIGRCLEFNDLPAGGTSDTVMKTAHAAVARRHRVSYGSIARFAADLSSPDESYAVILGGQDGWLGSDTLLDQVSRWREGRAIRLPLRPETVAREFTRVMKLEPG